MSNSATRPRSLAPSTSMEQGLIAFNAQVGSSPAACAGLTGDAGCQPAPVRSVPLADDRQQQPRAACRLPPEDGQPAAAAATTTPVPASPASLGDTIYSRSLPANLTHVLSIEVWCAPAAKGQPLRSQGFELQAFMLRAQPRFACPLGYRQAVVCTLDRNKSRCCCRGDTGKSGLPS